MFGWCSADVRLTGGGFLSFLQGSSPSTSFHPSLPQAIDGVMSLAFNCVSGSSTLEMVRDASNFDECMLPFTPARRGSAAAGGDLGHWFVLTTRTATFSTTTLKYEQLGLIQFTLWTHSVHIMDSFSSHYGLIQFTLWTHSVQFITVSIFVNRNNNNKTSGLQT